jgi:hypothetical protein
MYLQIGVGLASTPGTVLQEHLGQSAPPFPSITAVTFRTGDSTTSDPNNCCPVCPINLGVGQGGTASNGIEIQLTVAGHRPGFEYDILRTFRNSLWERTAAGVWRRLERFPMGTADDRHADDECLTPRGNRLFVIDRPGWTGALPAPAGTVFPGLGAGVAAAADARDVVDRSSFAEWVNARNLAEGIPWTRLQLPGGAARRFIFWQNVIWLTRDGANRWVLDRARSRIGPGIISARTIDSPPA